MLSATGNGSIAIELSVREEFEQSMPNLLRGSQTMPDRGFRAPALFVFVFGYCPAGLYIG